MAICALGLLGSQWALAQTVTVSPAILPFGIPTGTSPAISAEQTVTVNVTGSGTVTFAATPPVPFPVSAGSPFTVTGDSCQGTVAAPTTCQVSLTFSSSSPTLQTDTLNIAGSFTTASVALSGAFGAINLFGETNVTSTNATFSSLYTIATKTLNLTCPASPTAIVSGTPDGLGYVLVDNYMTLAVGPALTRVNDPNSTEFPAGNICGGTGAVADSGPGGYYGDCFTSNYQNTAFDNLNLLLQNPDPDLFANPNNALLPKDPPNKDNAGGVPPLDIHSFITGPYPEQALFTLLTSGYETVYDNSTLFLITNCTAPGVVPGASVTLNTVNTNDPSSQTQTATLDSSSNQNISFTTSDAVAIQSGAGINSGIVPIITDFAVPQQLFSQLVSGATGTSAAPAVCLRLTGELDALGKPMCKGYLLQCFNPKDGTTSGDNCDATSNSLRNLYYSARFSTPDGPVGYNYLTTQPWAPNNPYSSGQTIVDSNGNVQQVTTAGTSGATTPIFNPTVGGTTPNDGTVTWTNEGVNACANIGPGKACAAGTGPGVLMGSDNWFCAPGQSVPCTPPEPPAISTATPTSPPTYSNANCALSGALVGDLCPLDLLTQFLGAADMSPGGTGTHGNSVFVSVVNMPLPTATASVAGENASGWINSPSTATATFNSAAAVYAGTGANPPQNNFVPAAIYSLTYGFSTYPAVPDTTYPVTGDNSNYNQFALSSPMPPSTFCNNGGTTPPTFGWTTSAGSFGSLLDGLYNLHYFTTDCAMTQSLVFNPTAQQLNDATSNWASFAFLTFGVDTQAPAFSACGGPTIFGSNPPMPATPTASGWYNTDLTVQCQANDPGYSAGVSGSGFAPALPNGIQGSSSKNVSVSTSVGSGNSNPSAFTSVPSACDLASNCTNGTAAGPYMIDEKPPAVTVSAGSTSVGGAAITVTFTCSDAGSGIPSGGCTVSGTPANYVSNGCNPGSGASVICGGTIPALVVESGTLMATATDNAGNAMMASAGYAVNPGTPIITFGPAPTPTYLGPNFTVSATTTNTDSNILTFSVMSGPCAFVSGSTFSSTGAGVCTVKASGAATANFKAASNTQKVTIAKAQPVVTFGPPPTPTYLGGNFTVSATTTNTDRTTLTYSVVSGPCALVGGSTFRSTGAGICTVMASGAATVNFLAASNTQNVTISPATPKITFGPPPNPKYPGSNFVVSATTNSNGAITFSAQSGPCTFVSQTSTTGTFTPTGVGMCVVLASTAATTNFTAGSNTQSVTITGGAAATLTPSSLNFGTVRCGQHSSLPATLKNTGGVALTITSIKTSGGSDIDDFTETNKCGKSLAVGASCTITVTYSSDDDNGEGVSANLYVNDNAPGSPQSVALSGNTTSCH